MVRQKKKKKDIFGNTSYLTGTAKHLKVISHKFFIKAQLVLYIMHVFLFRSCNLLVLLASEVIPTCLAMSSTNF